MNYNFEWLMCATHKNFKGTHNLKHIYHVLPKQLQSCVYHTHYKHITSNETPETSQYNTNNDISIYFSFVQFSTVSILCTLFQFVITTVVDQQYHSMKTHRPPTQFVSLTMMLYRIMTAQHLGHHL